MQKHSYQRLHLAGENLANTCIMPVQATLRHAVEALMLEENSAVPGLQPAVGRLASALVAVLGPELTLGSPAYCSCRALIREMQVGFLHHSCSGH